MKEKLSRRRFLSKFAAGAAGWLILRDGQSVWGVPANEKINVALIGVGGRGTWFVDTIPRMENVVAICDVNEQKIAETFKRWSELADRFTTSPHEWERSAAPAFRRLADKKVPSFSDFRKMLDAMDKQIDAVVVSTPDHTHAVASAAAIKAGKHVFCEKPLTRTIDESRVLRELARKHKVATSMGNQGTASGQFRRALELIRDGTIGRIKEVHVWNTGGGADRKEPPGQEPVPGYLNWDLWLGPAAFRPYHRGWLTRNLWRDFGTCQLGNWASQSANLAFMALKVHELWLTSRPGEAKPIIRIKAESSGINRLSFPRWEVVRWEIPARAEFSPITFNWYNGAAPVSQEHIEGLLGDSGWGDNKQMDHAGREFRLADEIFQYGDPYDRGKVRVLLSLDPERTNMGVKWINRDDNDFALAWVKTYGKGRVFYTSFGHRTEFFWNSKLLKFYLDAIQFVAGDLEAPTEPRSDRPVKRAPRPTPPGAGAAKMKAGNVPAPSEQEIQRIEAAAISLLRCG